MITKTRNVMLVFALLSVAAFAVVRWETSTPTTTNRQSQVTFQVEWTDTAPADALYQIGGAAWVDLGSMHPVAQHKGYISDPVPYDPRVTYRWKVMQYDRFDITQLRILVDGHLKVFGDNQHPPRVIPQIELRGN